MSLSDLLLIILSAFYMAYAITLTDGPLHVFAALRKRFPLGGLITCFVCAVFWCGLIAYLVSLIAPQILMPFAGAGAATLLFRYTGGSSNV